MYMVEIATFKVHVFCISSNDPLHWCGFMKISQMVSVMELT